MDQRAAFIDAMKKKNPRLYAFIANQNPALLHLHGFGDSFGMLGATTAPAAQTSWWQDLLGTVAKALPIGITAYQEVNLAKAQVANAKAGQPPINMQPYIQSSVPTATVSVGVNPDTQKMLMYGGIGLVVIVLIAMMPKGGGAAKAKARA